LKDSPELVRIDVQGAVGASSHRRLSYGFRERAICEVRSAGLRFRVHDWNTAPSARQEVMHGPKASSRRSTTCSGWQRPFGRSAGPSPDQKAERARNSDARSAGRLPGKQRNCQRTWRFRAGGGKDYPQRVPKAGGSPATEAILRWKLLK